MAKAGATVNPEDFYPPVKQHRGKSRDLPMVDSDLRAALEEYHLHVRLEKGSKLRPSDPLQYAAGTHGAHASRMDLHRKNQLAQRTALGDYQCNSQAKEIRESRSENCSSR